MRDRLLQILAIATGGKSPSITNTPTSDADKLAAIGRLAKSILDGLKGPDGIMFDDTKKD